jgi:DNA-binding MarR family transcriptional regulator
MLLDLYVAAEIDAPISTTSLCLAANVRQTTALRWIRRLERAGLTARSGDEVDRRRRYVALTPMGIKAMRSYLGQVA